MSNTNESIIVNQFNTSHLSQYSYYIENDKEAAVIDPVVDNQPYFQSIQSNKSKLKYILNTHTHSDFISGSIDLGSKTGATLIFGPESWFSINGIVVNKNNISETTEELSNFNIKVKFLNHNDRIKLGKIEIELLYTPGHTIDSCSYIIIDGNNKSNSAFVGDTILVGDIGKIDIPVLNTRKDHIYQKDLALMYYNTLRYLKEAIPEDLVIYPLHSYGYSMSKYCLHGQSTTLEKEKIHNKFIKDISFEVFLNYLNEDSIKFPSYFNHITHMNLNYLSGKSFDYVLHRQHKPVDSQTFFKGLINKEFKVLDARHPFYSNWEGIIKGSILISIKAAYSTWAGFLLNPDDPIVVIANENKEKDAIGKLLKIGFRNIYGYLQGGFTEYINNFENILISLERRDLIEDFRPIKINIVPERDSISYVYNKDFTLVDVRESYEHLTGIFPNSLLTPLSNLTLNLNLFSKEKKYYFLCKTGIRSAMAVSILIKEGFNSKQLFILEGGFGKLKDKGVKI